MTIEPRSLKAEDGSLRASAAADIRTKLARSERVGAIPTASGAIARAAYAHAVQAGLKADALLKKAGLTRIQMVTPDIRIPARGQIRFLEETARELGDDCLGVRLALAVDLRELGLVYYVLASSDDLCTALSRAARYSTISNEGIHVSVRAGKEVTVSFAHVGIARAGDRQQIEFFVAILLRLCRHLTGRHLAPVRIRLMHHRGKMAPEFARFFGCTPECGARHDQVVLPQSVGRAALAQADPYLNKILLRVCDEILLQRRFKAGDWRSKVENAIIPLLPHGEATIATVARKLGVSARTLSRRLSAEETSFLDVVQSLRMRLAQQYFSEPEMSVARAAWLLGYRGPSAFSHAFKRWTGRSPRQQRARPGRSRA